MRKWTLLTLVVLLLTMLAGCVNDIPTTAPTNKPTTAPTTAPTTPTTVKNTCTVTFNNYDGTTVYTTEVEKGASVDMSKVPEVEHTYRKWYTFTGWDKTAEHVTEDIIITAQYSYNPIPDEAFEFVLLEDDTYGIRLADPDKDYSYLNLEGYVGFPEEYNGKPVTRILKEGVTSYALLVNTENVLIPASYKVIENRAFACAVKKLTVAEGVEEIWTAAFMNVSDADYSDVDNAIIYLPSTLNFMEPAALSTSANLVMTSGKIFTYDPIRKEILTDGGHTLVWKDMTNIANLTLDKYITALWPGLFANNYMLESVTFKGEIKELPVNTFTGCGGLSSLTMQPGLEKIWGSEQVEELKKGLKSDDSLDFFGGGNFSGVYSLNFELPETITHIGDFTFYNSSIPFLQQPISISANVEYIGINAFNATWASLIPSITVDPANQKYYSVNDSCLIERGTGINGGDTFMIYASAHPQTDFVIPNGVTSIHPFAVMGAYNLDSLTVPEGVETLPAAFLSSSLELWDEETFASTYDGLKKLVLPSTVKTLEAGFQDGVWGGVMMWGSYPCINTQALEELEFPNGCNIEVLPTSAISMGDKIHSFTFSKHTNLIEDAAVYGAEILFYVEEGNEKYISIGGSVYEKLGDKKLKLVLAARHSSVTVLDLTDLGEFTLVEIAENACYQNYFTKVILPEGVERIGLGAFSDCYSLTEVVLPSGLKEIGDMAFYYCSNLAEITMPAGLERIGAQAFYGCIGLTELVLPPSLKEIGDRAFYDCKGLQKVTFESTNAPTIGFQTFYTSVEVFIPEYGVALPQDVLIPGIAFNVPEGCYDAYYEAFAAMDPAMAEAIVKE